jgi:hypothetical protein
LVKKLHHTVLLGRKQIVQGSAGGLLQAKACAVPDVFKPGTPLQQVAHSSSALCLDFLRPFHAQQKSSEAGSLSPLEQLRRNGEKLLSEAGLDSPLQIPDRNTLALPPGIVLRKRNAASSFTSCADDSIT